MSEEVMRKHIDLYVNHFSINLGEEGKSAIQKLMQVYEETHGLRIGHKNIFVA